jgi:hypothetical protein
VPWLVWWLLVCEFGTGLSAAAAAAAAAWPEAGWPGGRVAALHTGLNFWQTAAG